MNKQELIERLKALRDVEIWAARNFKREDFKTEEAFLKGLEKYRKQAEYYNTVMKFAEQLEEPKECKLAKKYGYFKNEYTLVCSKCRHEIKNFAFAKFCEECGAKIIRKEKQNDKTGIA